MKVGETAYVAETCDVATRSVALDAIANLAFRRLEVRAGVVLGAARFSVQPTLVPGKPPWLHLYEAEVIEVLS